uniref:HTH CENPB-type domain-containing protein n=1 Tax=Graphocephala atropunctata TaxID=36148 RepID=A0A1B6L3T1_9HEMI
MVRNYTRKTDRQKWDKNAMSEAIEAVISGEMGFLKAARQFNVPKSSLERYVNKKKKNPEYKVDKTDGKFKNVFSVEQEFELVKYLKSMESRLFGLTMKDLRSLAFQLAERNGLNHRFDKSSGLAGQDWVKGFLSRHPTLSIRTPESTSGARAMGFNKIAVSQFFSLLTETIDKHKLTSERIYNVDETGVSVNPKCQSKVIALKGKRQVGALTSAERGETVTATVCMSASGSYMPPMLIFPRIKKKQEFELGLPPGAWSETHATGWMTKELFLSWLSKFIKFSGAKKESPVLLVVDGHSTHTKNLELIDMARENGVVLLCLPPHTSHKLQPLDVTFYNPLSLYYGEEIKKWLRCNPGKVVTLFQISTLFGAAFLRAASMTTAIKGFVETGIWPTDPNVFTDADFLPAATTDIQLDDKDYPSEVPDQGSDVAVPEKSSTSTTQQAIEPPSKKAKPSLDMNLHSRPGCSWMPDEPIFTPQTKENTSAFHSASPEILIPIPLIKQNVKRTNRKRGKTVVLTDSPYKNELKEAIAEKARIEKEKERKKKEREMKAMSKGKLVAKRLFETKGTIAKPGKKIKVKVEKRKQTENKSTDSDSDSNEEEDDAECLYCNELYSSSNEGWIACQVCLKWAHNSCAGIDSEEDEDILICEFCQ